MRVSLLLSLIILGCTPSTTTFVEIDNPTSEHAKYPRLFTDNTGVVFMSWYEIEGDSTSLYYSTYSESTWSEKHLISSSDSWFVNWADFASIIGINGNPLAAHWLTKKPGGTYSYDVTISAFTNSFTTPFNPHLDNTPTEHGFVSLIPETDASYYAIWLDGRNMKGHDHGSDNHMDLSNAMSIRWAHLNNETILNDGIIDASTCECCNTSIVQVKDGLLAAYRNRTEDEIRDIYTSKFSFDTNEWSVPKSVHNDNWNIAACPVNGPMMDAVDDNVVLAWFTGVNNEPKVQVTFSDDAGDTWSDPIVIDQKTPLGRVDVLLDKNGEAQVIWITRENDQASLKLATINRDGIKNIKAINSYQPDRASGFPQLTKTDNRELIAWTDVSGDFPIIKTVISQ